MGTPRRHRLPELVGGALLLITVAVLGITLAVLYSMHGRITSPRVALYAQRAVSIHAARSEASSIVRTLALGDSVLATDPDTERWMAVSEPGGEAIGFVRPQGGLAPNPPPQEQRPAPPIAPPSAQGSRDSTPPSAGGRPAPADTTAICRDGWISRSKHASGTCSSHGGVAQWVHHP
ncbi:MAG TPA: DUF3761 domain-containing protein [Longimicrobium sp.]|nr:DUF3761 domain-containing protein [Longimicrobium sp.]